MIFFKSSNDLIQIYLDIQYFSKSGKKKVKILFLYLLLMYILLYH